VHHGGDELGSAYYAFPVLAPSISADTGWSIPAVTAGFSIGLVVSAVAGVPVGRLLDRVGPRPVMTSGTLLAIPATLALAAARTLPEFLAAWVPVGLAMGLFRPVAIVLEPYVQFFRFVPPVAWIIPAILWFGIGETSKIFLIFYTTVYLVLLNTMAGVAAVARNQIRSARCFGVSPRQLFLWVSLPATMPYVLTGMRLGMGNSFAAVVGAEFIASQSGLGFLILDSGTWMATDRMFAGMLTLGLLGIVADQLFRLVTGRWAARYLVKA